MQDAASNSNVMEELLRQRGLLATGGNIRSVPFATPSVNGVATTGSGTPPASGSSQVASALAGQPEVPTRDPNAVIEAAKVDPTVLDNLPDEEVSPLIPILVGAGGAALALYLKNRFGAAANVAPADPLAPLPPMPPAVASRAPSGMEDIIEGEFTEVADPLRVSATKQLTGPQAIIPASPSALENQAPIPGALTAQELAARRVNSRPTETGKPPIPLDDAMSDLDDQDMTKALMVTKRLIADRTAGRQRRYGDKKEGIGKKGLPTGEIDKEGVLNLVVKAIRDAKLAQPLRRAVTR